ncbi:hypothetical protein EV702DRAFT_1272533 [Suillus placidus]|uniref:Uncharacterized protein n=1 Tax=Suillus placidus TaxID=48579 RepID=A0A9P6ZFD1_9AGAM|nr:hypothetical protein EV702DRAFT_1272533 [Suillus placidus]
MSKKATRPKKRRRSPDDDEKKLGLALQQHDAAENGDVSEDEDTRVSRDKRLSKLSPKVQERYRRNFARLLQLTPSLKPLLADPRKASELNMIIKMMDVAISATRSDDTSCLKSQIGHYAAFNTKDHPIRPAIYDGSGSRTHMGFNHPILACFLCPDDADMALKNIQCGKIKVTAFALPAFLWAGDPPGMDYDNDNMFEGMFEGYLLERVRFGISAKNAWSEIDGAFNYREFYNNIIDLIEDSPDPEWKEELLKAWNMKLFKNEEGRDCNNTEECEKTTSSHEGRDNDLARVRAQMAARRAAKAIPTPLLSTHEPTPAPSTREPTPAPLVRNPTPPPPAREPTPPPPAREPSPAPSAREPSPPPTAPKPKPKPTAPAHKPKLAVPAHESTPVPLAYQSAHLTLPARLMPVSARAESHAPSDLTESEDSEPVQTAIKRKAKKAGGRATKRKDRGPAPTRKSSRK